MFRVQLAPLWPAAKTAKPASLCSMPSSARTHHDRPSPKASKTAIGTLQRWSVSAGRPPHPNHGSRGGYVVSCVDNESTSIVLSSRYHGFSSTSDELKIGARNCRAQLRGEKGCLAPFQQPDLVPDLAISVFYWTISTQREAELQRTPLVAGPKNLINPWMCVFTRHCFQQQQALVDVWPGSDRSNLSANRSKLEAMETEGE